MGQNPCIDKQVHDETFQLCEAIPQKLTAMTLYDNFSPDRHRLGVWLSQFDDGFKPLRSNSDGRESSSPETSMLTQTSHIFNLILQIMRRRVSHSSLAGPDHKYFVIGHDKQREFEADNEQKPSRAREIRAERHQLRA